MAFYAIIKYCYSDLLLKKYFIYGIFGNVCCTQTCYCIDMVSVMSASFYLTSASRFQSRPLSNIRGLIQRGSSDCYESINTNCLYKQEQFGRITGSPAINLHLHLNVTCSHQT